MINPFAHSLLVKAATLEQEARDHTRVRNDETHVQPMQWKRRRPAAAPGRRLRLPSIPLPRRLAHAVSR